MVLCDTLGIEELGPTQGQVDVTYDVEDDGTTKVVTVGAVSLNLGLPFGECFDRIVAHECAHFWENSVRMQLGLIMPNSSASMVWSEYLAERVRWLAGFRHTGGIGPIESAVAIDRSQIPAWCTAYLNAQVIAIYHAAQSRPSRSMRPELQAEVEALLQSPLAKALLVLYTHFPRWGHPEPRAAMMMLGDATMGVAKR